jgi:hypothetical protein
MKIKFNESTKDNPLLFFEDFFSVNGQLKMKKEFLSKVLPYVDPNFDTDDETIDYDTFNYNLENHVFTEYIDLWDYETETKKIASIDHTFYDHIKTRLEKEASISFILIKQRIDGCDTIDSEKYVVNKMKLKSNKMLDFLEKNKQIPFQKKLNSFIQEKITNVIIYATKSDSLSIKPEKTNNTILNNLLDELLSELNIFEDDDQIKCFIELVINKNLNHPIAVEKLYISCEMWVFKKLISKLNSVQSLKWKNTDLEKCKLFKWVKGDKDFKSSHLKSKFCKSRLKELKVNKVFNSHFSK